jgi:RNA polymerase-binding transcription factor DksA
MDADDTAFEPATEPAPAPPAAESSTPLDLDGIQRDLADVEVALARLDAGTYWTDEVTGHDLPAELLEQHPTARRVLAE